MLTALLLGLSLVPQQPAGSLAKRIDEYLDARFEPKKQPTARLVAELVKAGVDATRLEAALRTGRAHYPPAPERTGKLIGPFPLACDHVEREVSYLLYVPRNYDPKRAAPLLVVGHGGSAVRDLKFGEQAARIGCAPWIAFAETSCVVLVAPLTDRGWGWIGNSILFSAISRLSRDYHIDPDRIYLTGHSMGGHLSWRSAICFGDHFAAISPMSGGYDFVKDRQIYNCINVPGYATWGSDDLYQINDFGRIMAEWMKAHDFPWQMVEKHGGHEIFPTELPKVARFFQSHPRDLYRRSVYLRAGDLLQYDKAETNAAWGAADKWRAGRVVPASTAHWLRLWPLGDDVAKDLRTQAVSATYEGSNRFSVTAEHSQRLSIYLHPKMVDFGKPITVEVNGKNVLQHVVAPDLATMLELVREFDDRGRIFWARVDVKVPGSKDPGEPRGAGG